MTYGFLNPYKEYLSPTRHAGMSKLLTTWNANMSNSSDETLANFKLNGTWKREYV